MLKTRFYIEFDCTLPSYKVFIEELEKSTGITFHFEIDSARDNIVDLTISKETLTCLSLIFLRKKNSIMVYPDHYLKGHYLYLKSLYILQQFDEVKWKYPRWFPWWTKKEWHKINPIVQFLIK